MLKLTAVVSGYGSFPVLRGVSMEVPTGKIVTLLGANGAGKSTMLKTISGIVPTSSGSMLYDDTQLNHKSVKDIVRHRIIHCPEGRQIFPHITVRDNLRLGFYLSHNKREFERILNQIYLYFPKLKDREKQYAGTLSGGEQQMLAIGRALMAGPKLLLLDEPSLGLAPLAIEEIMGTICEINKNGVSVLLVEQNARLALSIADYGYVMEEGKIVMEGPGNTLREDIRIQELYLGMTK